MPVAGNGGGVSHLHEEEEAPFHSDRFVSYGVTSSKSANASVFAQDNRAPTARQFWHIHFSTLLELACSYILTVVAFNSRANPATMGLVYAGLAHMASSYPPGYYLQANPVLTLGQLARGHIDLLKASTALAAQLAGAILAVATFSFGGNGLHDTILPAITTCDSVPWTGALLTEAIYTGAFVFAALGAWDSMVVELQSTCTHYGICVGAAFFASVTGIQCRGMGSALLNPWVGLIGFLCEVMQVSHVVTSCRGIHILGPLLGCGIGVLLSWVTSLSGHEKEAFLRSMAPLAPLALECSGVAILVISLGITNSEPTAGYLVALTLISWRRSGAQFNPALTLSIYLIKREVFQWPSLIWTIVSQVLGAFIGVLLLVSLPISRQAVPPLDESLFISFMDFVLIFLYSIVWNIIFLSATEGEFEEGFLHPALVAAISLTGLIMAYSPDPVASALYNPAISLVLGITLGAFNKTLLLLASQLGASPVAWAFFWLKNKWEL